MNPDILVYNLLHLRYKPKRKNFKGCAPCPAFRLFDWVIWLPDSLFSCRCRRSTPRTVLCLAHPKSLRILEKSKSRLKNATVIIAGEDTNLSHVLPTVEALLPYSRKIYYEAKDVMHTEIKSFCMGFISFYLKRVDAKIISHFVTLVSNPEWKKEGVLASWGGVWKHLDNTLQDRYAAGQFIKECDWIEREKLGPVDYWNRLAESKFLLAPSGQGVQAPKLAEAWLMRTIPIVTVNPCFSDLQQIGFPMLILEKWEDLTLELLREFEVKNSAIDWLKVQSMLTLESFASCYLSLGQVSEPETISVSCL
jgi:hypothetical protein